MDYSAVGFAMFFLGEYSNMLIMSAVVAILFLGGWLFPFSFFPEFIFSLKIVLVSFYFIWVRATVPRIRYDFLMNLGWKKLLPFAFSFFIFMASFLFSIDGLPMNGFFELY
jgi:NADH-quinone oxidoreductase subunit H